MINEQQPSPEIDSLLAKILVGDVESLPMLPSSLAEILRLDTRDDRYFDKVRELAESDPTFAVRLIKLANSAANAPANEITSLRLAIARIGMDQIRSLMTTFAVAQIFVPTYPEERAIWKHSLLVALSAREIAKMVPETDFSPEQAYLCGLLHDIGRYIMLRRYAEGHLRHDEKDWVSPVALVAEENARSGINHVQLGKAACEKWGLPKTITAVVGHHHTYMYDSDTIAERRIANAVQIVQMADYFAMTMMRHPDLPMMTPEAFEEQLAESCIHPGWKAPPVPPLRLFERAGLVRAEAIRILRSMGLADETDLI